MKVVQPQVGTLLDWKGVTARRKVRLFELSWWHSVLTTILLELTNSFTLLDYIDQNSCCHDADKFVAAATVGECEVAAAAGGNAARLEGSDGPTQGMLVWIELMASCIDYYCYWVDFDVLKLTN